MSFGALSYEAKTALARGATMAGTATCSGEGGMIPDERRYSEKYHRRPQMSRFGFQNSLSQVLKGKIEFVGMVKGRDDPTYIRLNNQAARLERRDGLQPARFKFIAG